MESKVVVVVVVGIVISAKTGRRRLDCSIGAHRGTINNEIVDHSDWLDRVKATAALSVVATSPSDIVSRSLAQHARALDRVLLHFSSFSVEEQPRVLSPPALPLLGAVCSLLLKLQASPPSTSLLLSLAPLVIRFLLSLDDPYHRG